MLPRTGADRINPFEAELLEEGEVLDFVNKAFYGGIRTLKKVEEALKNAEISMLHRVVSSPEMGPLQAGEVVTLGLADAGVVVHAQPEEPPAVELPKAEAPADDAALDDAPTESAADLFKKYAHQTQDHGRSKDVEHPDDA